MACTPLRCCETGLAVNAAGISCYPSACDVAGLACRLPQPCVPSYVGGSVNFAATSQSLGLTPGPVLAASMAADNIAMAIYLTGGAARDKAWGHLF